MLMDKKSLVLAVKFYRTAAGNEPVREFLKQLSKDDRITLGTDLKEVQFGWPLGMPLVRKLDDRLWEIRSILRDCLVRMLFTVVDSQLVLLHAFTKQSQKIPQKDLALAVQRLRSLCLSSLCLRSL
jgi:phage-related protein